MKINFRNDLTKEIQKFDPLYGLSDSLQSRIFEQVPLIVFLKSFYDIEN